MKKIYIKIQNFLSRHCSLWMFLVIITTLITGIILIDSYFQDIWGTSFVCALYAGIRIYTYRNGKIFLFMSDKSWNIMSAKYGREDAEQKYKKMSLQHATIFSMISWIVLIISFVLEVIYLNSN